MSRLLIVDDESNIRHLYSLLLSEEGYDLEATASASEAEQKLTENNFDLVLLDIKLKNENGLNNGVSRQKRTARRSCQVSSGHGRKQKKPRSSLPMPNGVQQI